MTDKDLVLIIWLTLLTIGFIFLVFDMFDMMNRIKKLDETHELSKEIDAINTSMVKNRVDKKIKEVKNDKSN